ncbi:hypothetical protein ACOSQ3_009532 [Xanthoceras sorbifolium]
MSKLCRATVRKILALPVLIPCLLTLLVRKRCKSLPCLYFQVLEASMAGVFVFSAQSEPMSLEEVKERPPDAAMNSKEARADLGEEVEGLTR